jgi:hypothetical protein
MDSKGGNTMNGELIALVDSEMEDGTKKGMMLGTGITDVHAVDKMLAMVETIQTNSMLVHHITKVTFVSKLNKKPKTHYVHPGIDCKEDGSMNLGGSIIWFELILAVDISRDIVINVENKEEE